MSSKYFEDLGDIYSDNISEKPEQSQLNENVAVDAKADNGAFSKDAGHKMIKDSGPEAAEGVEDVENDTKKDKKGKSAYNEENLSHPVKSSKKAVKNEASKINNSTMKEKSNQTSFDKLFEDVMGGDLDLDLGNDMDMGGDDMDMNGDEDMGEGGDVAGRLESLIGELQGILDELRGGEDEDMGDIEDIEDTEGEDDLEMPESHVELQAAPDSVGHLTGKNNKAALSTDGGSASSDAGGQEDGGKPKAAKDAVAHMTGKGNKVGNVKGGNAFSH